MPGFGKAIRWRHVWWFGIKILYQFERIYRHCEFNCTNGKTRRECDKLGTAFSMFNLTVSPALVATSSMLRVTQSFD